MTVSYSHFGLNLVFESFLRFVRLVLFQQNFIIRLLLLETTLFIWELFHLEQEVLLR
jgi:hypothetical protein